MSAEMTWKEIWKLTNNESPSSSACTIFLTDVAAKFAEQTKSIAEVIVMKESFLLLVPFAESFTGGDTTSWENERSALEIILKCTSNLPLIPARCNRKRRKKKKREPQFPLLRRRQDQPLVCLFLSSVHAFSIRADSRLTSCVCVFYSFTHVCFCFVLFFYECVCFPSDLFYLPGCSPEETVKLIDNLMGSRATD